MVIFGNKLILPQNGKNYKYFQLEIIDKIFQPFLLYLPKYAQMMIYTGILGLPWQQIIEKRMRTLKKYCFAVEKLIKI